MFLYKITVLFALITSILAQNCTYNDIKCPSTGSFNVCAGNSLDINIIFRCSNGCPQPGNCNDNLAGVPPVGVKTSAKCYQDGPTAGNAQCTFDCVAVTRADGSSFYPLGCTSSSSSSSILPSSSSSLPPSSSGTNPSSSASASRSASVSASKTISLGPSQTVSQTGTSPSPTGGSDGSGGQGGSDDQGGNPAVVSSTTFYTTTLPNGQLSTVSSIIAIATVAPPELSNDGNIVTTGGLVAIALVGLFAVALV